MSRMIWSLLNRIRKPDDPSSDAEIIRRFVQNRDEAAFELLVWRHGSLVLSVCRRMLRDDHAAEDAFQATFLILARKAASVRGSLPGWLHQVARRVCLRARQHVATEPVADLAAPVADSAESLLRTELSDILDEEIAGLPRKLRQAVVHCYLQGRTAEDAAKLLSIPRGTVLSRLFHARKLLTVRLNRRGIVAPATLVTGSLTLPTISADVCRRTVQAAIGFINRSIPATLSTQLAHEVLNMSAQKTAYTLAAVMILLAGLGTGVGMVMAQTGSDGQAKAPAVATELAVPADQPKQETKLSLENQKKVQQERLEQLLMSEERLKKNIRSFEDQKADLIRSAASEVDPKALQRKLEELDVLILEMEERNGTLPKVIQARELNLNEARAGHLSEEQRQTIRSRVRQRVNQTPEVDGARARFNNRARDFQQLKLQAKPEADLLKEAKRLYDESEFELQKIRDQVQPREERAVDKEFRENTILDLENALKQERKSFENAKENLIEAREKRVEWVQRIQNAKSKLDAQHQIDDEIQTLRDIRKQVLKERLMLEMGLAAPVK